MNEELQNQLLTYLGELMHQRDNQFDWIEKDRIIKKMNAVNVLFDIDIHEETAMQKVFNYFKNNPVTAQSNPAKLIL